MVVDVVVPLTDVVEPDGARVVVVVEVGSSTSCSGASTSRASPLNTASTAFMLSLLMLGSITELPLIILPVPSIWYVFIVSGSRSRMA